MRPSATLSIAAVSLAAVLGGTLVIGSNLVASATPARPDSSNRRAVLHLTAETDQFAVIDVGSKGPALGLGDQIVSTDRLSHHGQPAGRSGTIMTVVGTTPANLTTQVVTTLDLLDGQIVLHGIGDGPTGPPTDAVPSPSPSPEAPAPTKTPAGPPRSSTAPAAARPSPSASASD